MLDLKIYLEKISELIHKKTRGEAVTSFLGGSLAEGFGNPLSDIDVYVLTRDSQLPREWFIFNGKRVEIIYINTSYLDNLVSLSNGNSPNILCGCKHGDLIPLNDLDVSIAHSISKGIVITGEEEFHKIRNALNYTGLIRHRFISNQLLCDRHFQDSIGSLLDRDWNTAFFSARCLLEVGLDLLLLSLGEAFPRNKWRFRKAERTLIRDTQLYCYLCYMIFGAENHRREPWTYIINSLILFRAIQAIAILKIENCVENEFVIDFFNSEFPFRDNFGESGLNRRCPNPFIFLMTTGQGRITINTTDNRSWLVSGLDEQIDILKNTAICFMRPKDAESIDSIVYASTLFGNYSEIVCSYKEACGIYVQE